MNKIEIIIIMIDYYKKGKIKKIKKRQIKIKTKIKIMIGL
jgi:hypothetical protein